MSVVKDDKSRFCAHTESVTSQTSRAVNEVRAMLQKRGKIEGSEGSGKMNHKS